MGRVTCLVCAELTDNHAVCDKCFAKADKGEPMEVNHGPFDGKWSKTEVFEKGKPTNKSFIQLVAEALGEEVRKEATTDDR